MITIREILTIPRFHTVKVIAGHEGLDRTLSGVTIMDIPNLAKWMTGGELIFAGVLFEQCFSKQLVDDLIEKKVCGIVTKQKFLIQVDPAIMEYCNLMHFPILVAPADCNWGQLMNPIMSYMVRKPYAMIKESLDFQDTIMRAIIEGYSLSELCSYMYKTLQTHFSIFDPDLHLVCYSDGFDWKETTRRLKRRDLHFFGTRTRGLDEQQVRLLTYQTSNLVSHDVKILLYPVTMNSVNYGYIGLVIPLDLENLDPMHLAKIQQFALFIAFHTTKINEVNTATRRFNGLIMDRLILEEHPSKQEMQRLFEPLGKKLHRNYYVVSLIHDEHDSLTGFMQKNNRITRFLDAVEDRLMMQQHILTFEKTNAQFLLIPTPIESINDALQTIRQLFLQVIEADTLFIGVSDIVAIQNLRDGVEQAEHAANYLRSTRRSRPYLHYKDLGILRFFMDKTGAVDEVYLRNMSNQYIEPIIKYDEKHQTNLLETIELYFKNDCSKVKTEQELFIHRNTLRARFQTIGKILDCDLDRIEDRFQIQLALKLRFFLIDTK